MIAHVDNRITYNGNGNATEFAYQFKILDRTDIKVLLTDADGKEKLLTKDYYVDVEKNVVRYPGYAVGAEVPESERPPVLPTGWKLTIYREVPVTQETDLPDQYPFNQVEDIGDKLTMIAQQLTDVTGRSLKIGVSTSADIDTTIPWENGKSFRISDDGKTLELSEDPAKVLPLAQGVYAQTQAQAQSAAASATAAAKSEDSAFESAGVAGNSAQYASLSAASAAENAELTSGYKQEALTAKADATASATNAKASEANAKISENNAEASKEAAQSAATTASNFANASRSSANEARTYRDNAKNYSENVNVFTPSVSSAGVLSWTNKAGLTNPASVNIKGAKGDTGTAASITIGSVTTGAAGSNASVTNSGTASNAVLNFMLPRGKDGKDGGITVDAALSDTSINPVQNKVINKKIKLLTLPDGMLTTPSSPYAYVSKLSADVLAPINDVVHMVIEQSADGVVWETLFDNESSTDTNYKTAYLNGLRLPSMLDVIQGYMARITFTVKQSTMYLSSVSFFMLSLRSNDTAGNHYKCYYGYGALSSAVKVESEIQTWGSWVNAILGNTNYNTIQYVFNEERDASARLSFGGALCKGTVPYRNMLNFDMDNLRTSTSFPLEAPNFIGKVNGFDVKASVPASAKFIDNEASNTWAGQQTFNEAHIVKEVYQSEYINGTTITPTRSTVCLATTGATTLDMTNIVAECLGNNKTSTVFTAYITSNADYTLTITNAGTIKYSGSASDAAITSAGLLLNIMMLKDSIGNVTSIVQASKLS